MLKNLGKESAVYGIGQVINSAIAVLILPILTRSFSTAEIGLIDLLTVVETFGIIFSTLGVDTALTFYFWDNKHDVNKQKKYISTAFISLLLFSTLSFFLLLSLRQPIERFYLKGEVGQVYFYALLIIPFMCMYSLFAKLCRIFRKPILFNIITVTYVLIYILFVLLFIYKVNLGIEAVFIGKGVGYSIIIVISIIYFRKSLFHGIDFKYLKEMLAYGLPLTPLLLIDWIMKFSDRFFINQFLTTTELGYFAVYVKIAMGITIIVGAFNKAWGPFAMSIKDQAGVQNVYAKAMNVYIFLTFIAALCIQMVSPVLVRIFATQEYLARGYLIGFLSVPIIFHGMYGIVSVGLNITKKNIFITFGVLIASLINIALDYFLIPKYGLTGATIATSTGYFSAILIIYLLSKKIYPIPFTFNKIIIVTGILICLMYLITFIYNADLGLIINILIDLGLLVLFFGAFVYLKIIQMKDVKKIFLKLKFR